MSALTKSVAGTNSSVVVERCQICDNSSLEPILFLGYLPPVNRMNPIGEKPREQSSYPAQLLYCPQCHLVQLGLIVDPQVLFPAEYPYTSSTTKILRENFAELYGECKTVIELGTNDLVVDIGSNDGNLLANFKDHHRVLGITPERIGEIAIERGVPTIIDYFSQQVVETVLAQHGQARIITATNVFAHIENVNTVVELIIKLMAPKSLFISESHYLLSLIETLQYDTIYHEHLRYYSLHSLKFLLESHGLEIAHAKKIPTHGGSIRVYSARRGDFPVHNTVNQLLEAEKSIVLGKEALLEFKDRVVLSKLELQSLLLGIKQKGQRIYGISAPSRGSTLINYAGLDDGILDCILEIQGSHKIGKYLPGTLIPVVEETRLYEDQPEYALLLSWHIADELIPKLKQKGFQGSFIVPLPKPRVVK
ncbi:MAG: class I SAM-dependent methyltransferase [Syntrophobacteraceae bacterium]